MTDASPRTLAPDRPPLTEGTLDVRVRYAECDAMGLAHHAGYAVWLEAARTELLRASGISYADMEAAGLFLVVTRMELKFRRPIRYDDVIRIETRVKRAAGVRLTHAYELRLLERRGGEPDRADPSVPSDGVCAVAETELACVGRDGRPTPMPAWLSMP